MNAEDELDEASVGESDESLEDEGKDEAGKKGEKKNGAGGKEDDEKDEDGEEDEEEEFSDFGETTWGENEKTQTPLTVYSLQPPDHPLSPQNIPVEVPLHQRFISEEVSSFAPHQSPLSVASPLLKPKDYWTPIEALFGDDQESIRILRKAMGTKPPHGAGKKKRIPNFSRSLSHIHPFSRARSSPLLSSSTATGHNKTKAPLPPVTEPEKLQAAFDDLKFSFQRDKCVNAYIRKHPVYSALSDLEPLFHSFMLERINEEPFTRADHQADPDEGWTPKINKALHFMCLHVRDIGAFPHLSNRQLEMILKIMTIERFPAGSWVFKVGDPGLQLCLLLEGLAGVYTERPPDSLDPNSLEEKRRRNSNANTNMDSGRRPSTGGGGGGAGASRGGGGASIFSERVLGSSERKHRAEKEKEKDKLEGEQKTAAAPSSVLQEKDLAASTGMRAVMELSAGMTFGDAAIYGGDGRRMVSVRCSTDCYVGFFQKDNWSIRYRESHNEEATRLAAFLTSLPAFAGWTGHQVRTLAHVCKAKKFEPGETIIQPEMAYRGVAFLMSGSALVFRQVDVQAALSLPVEMQKRQTWRQVWLLTLPERRISAGEAFGVDAVHGSASAKGMLVASETCEVAQITAADFLRYVKGRAADLLLAEVGETKTDEELRQSFASEKKWAFLRKRILDRVTQSHRRVLERSEDELDDISVEFFHRARPPPLGDGTFESIPVIRWQRPPRLLVTDVTDFEYMNKSNSLRGSKSLGALSEGPPKTMSLREMIEASDRLRGLPDTKRRHGGQKSQVQQEGSGASRVEAEEAKEKQKKSGKRGDRQPLRFLPSHANVAFNESERQRVQRAKNMSMVRRNKSLAILTKL